jgi:ABC-type sulfate transport system substrate-binding protein
MALSENDKNLIKYLGVSEQEFEKLDVAEQGKKLNEAMKAYIKDRSSEKKLEYYENAKTIVPKIKEQLEKPVMVYARNVGANAEGKVAAYAFAGYVYGKKKKAYLLFNPESDADVLKTYQVDENDILSSEK